MNRVLKDIRSFRRDWRRWSALERAAAELAAAAFALIVASSLAAA